MQRQQRAEAWPLNGTRHTEVFSPALRWGWSIAVKISLQMNHHTHTPSLQFVWGYDGGHGGHRQCTRGARTMCGNRCDETRQRHEQNEKSLHVANAGLSDSGVEPGN